MRSKSVALRSLLCALAAIIFGGCLLLEFPFPIFTSLRENARSPQCRNNLRQIGLALSNYHDVHGSFPPAYVLGPDGKRWHSWRVLLLPYLDQTVLYRKYRFDEPWNGPRNSLLHSDLPAIYRCPTGPHYDNLYFAVVGPHTAWPAPAAATRGDFPDGLTNTMSVVEQRDTKVHWMEPRDLEFDNMSFQLNDPSANGISSHHVRKGGWPFSQTYPHAWVLMADGIVRSMRPTVDARTLQGFLTADGGDHVSQLPEDP